MAPNERHETAIITSGGSAEGVLSPDVMLSTSELHVNTPLIIPTCKKLIKSLLPTKRVSHNVIECLPITDPKITAWIENKRITDPTFLTPKNLEQ